MTSHGAQQRLTLMEYSLGINLEFAALIVQFKASVKVNVIVAIVSLSCNLFGAMLTCHFIQEFPMGKMIWQNTLH